MRERVSLERLELICLSLNQATGSPVERFQPGTTKMKVGHYCLDGAYGGWRLVRIANEGGGEHNVLGCGFETKRTLLGLMLAYRDGMEDACHEQAKKGGEA